MAPSLNAGASGGADGANGVEARKANTVIGHSVEVGRFYERVAIEAYVAEAQVVGHEEDDIRLLPKGGEQQTIAKRELQNENGDSHGVGCG